MVENFDSLKNIWGNRVQIQRNQGLRRNELLTFVLTCWVKMHPLVFTKLKGIKKGFIIARAVEHCKLE